MYLIGYWTLAAYTMCHLVTNYAIMNNWAQLLFIRHAKEQWKTWKLVWGSTVACQPLFWPGSTTTLQSMNETGRLQLTSTPRKCHEGVLVDSDHCSAEQLHGYDETPRCEEQHRKSWYLQNTAECQLISNIIHWLRDNVLMFYSSDDWLIWRQEHRQSALLWIQTSGTIWHDKQLVKWSTSCYSQFTLYKRDPLSTWTVTYVGHKASPHEAKGKKYFGLPGIKLWPWSWHASTVLPKPFCNWLGTQQN
jgi:hypothetical protein